MFGITKGEDILTVFSDLTESGKIPCRPIK
jgi:hypothetical protein